MFREEESVFLKGFYAEAEDVQLCGNNKIMSKNERAVKDTYLRLVRQLKALREAALLWGRSWQKPLTAEIDPLEIHWTNQGKHISLNKLFCSCRTSKEHIFKMLQYL